MIIPDLQEPVTRPLALPDDAPPQLMVLVDAEEEFDWSEFSPRARTVSNIERQVLAHRAFERHGIVPTYLVDYPVATQAEAYGLLRELSESGQCEIGTQLHPWVNPPYEEEITTRNTCAGNLPRALEHEKLARLTGAIEANLRIKPIIYRAGRHGFGVNTAELLHMTGYRLDSSVLPRTDLRHRFAPDYSAFGPEPFWFGPGMSLLEIPETVQILGAMSRFGAGLYPGPQAHWAKGIRLRAILARLRMLDRIRLSPEGMRLSEAKRLTNAQVAAGQKLFVLSYHSSSLQPGSTPYVKNESDLGRFLEWLDQYFGFFASEIGGRFTTPNRLLPEVAGQIGNPSHKTQDRRVSLSGDRSPGTRGQPARARIDFRDPRRRVAAPRWMRWAKGRASNLHRPGTRPDIFAFSTPRSGSTLLLEILAAQSGMKVFNEPLNIHKPEVQSELGVSSWEELTLLREREQAFERYFGRLIRNEIPSLNQPAYWRTGRLITNRITFKILHGGEDMVDWFERTFGGLIVILIRHPIANALSHRQYPRLHHLIQQPGLLRLMSDAQLCEAKAIIDRQDFFELGILNWCLQNLPFAPRHLRPSWTLVSYEELSVRSPQVIERLTERLQLDPVAAPHDLLARPSRSTVQSDPGTKRILSDPEVEQRGWTLISKWRSQVSGAEIARAFDILDTFGLDYYEPEQDLPRAAYRMDA